MDKRLNVLISAYACEPGRGSEPEVGWRWALEMAHYHDVTVLTRANNRLPIESGLANLASDAPRPEFVYLDLSDRAQRWKRRLGATQLYYGLWQRKARRTVADLVASRRFDLLHHSTFAGYRYPIAIAGHGVPSLWGPVGGAESIPTPLLPWKHASSLARESFRNLINVAQTRAGSSLQKRCRDVTRTLASTPEMQRVIAALHSQADLMPAIGMDIAGFPTGPRPARRPGPLRLLYVGYLQALKGIDLALEALRESGTDATLTLVGDGNFTDPCKALTHRLALSDRVHFLGRRPRAEVLRLYPEFDVVMFPSLHDTGGYTVLEGLANGLPTICLDCGGPALAVNASCGIKVPLGNRSEVVRGLANAIQTYDKQRELLSTQADAARAVVARQYDWKSKGRLMDTVYHEVANAG